MMSRSSSIEIPDVIGQILNRNTESGITRWFVIRVFLRTPEFVTESRTDKELFFACFIEYHYQAWISS
jgi:hypothetical protein